MRIGLVALVLLGAAAAAMACPIRDLDNTASGGPVEISGEGPYKVLTQTVPARPSLYFHRGVDDDRSPSTYVDEAGRPVPMVVVYTGLERYPIRYDLAIERGGFFDSKYRHLRYVVDPDMVPGTQRITTKRWNGDLVIDITTDAALLRVEQPDSTYVVSVMGHQVLYFATDSVRITAMYGDRRDEVIFAAAAAPVSPAPPARRWDWALLLVLAVLALALTATRDAIPAPQRAIDR